MLARLSPDFPFGNSIRGVMVKLVEWDGRQVVGGIVLFWANGHQDRYEFNFRSGMNPIQVRGGRGWGGRIAAYGGARRIPHCICSWPQWLVGLQHIQHDFLVCTFRYVDNLTFVLSTGRVLGGEEHIGGDGGGLKHSLARLQPKFNVTNMHLQGVKGTNVRSQGVALITNVTFLYKVAADERMESKDMEVRETFQKHSFGICTFLYQYVNSDLIFMLRFTKFMKLKLMICPHPL